MTHTFIIPHVNECHTRLTPAPEPQSGRVWWVGKSYRLGVGGETPTAECGWGVGCSHHRHTLTIHADLVESVSKPNAG